MQYSLAAIVAFAASAFAYVDATPGFNPLVAPTPNEVLPAGKPYVLQWTPAGTAGAVNFVLTAGKTFGTLQEVGTVASGIDATLGKYTWNVDASLGKDAAYGLKIVLASNPDVYQWSNPFTIKAIEDGSSTAAANTTTAAASTYAVSTPASTTTTAAAVSTYAVKSNSTVALTTSAAVSSTTAAGTAFVTQTTKVSASGASTAAATSTSPVVTGAAASLGFSSAALVGGVFAAVLAL